MTTYVFIICRISLYTESTNSEGSMDDAGCKSGWQRAAAAAGGARAVAGDRERSRRDRQDALSVIERGERKPTLETFYRIGEALHMRPSAVLAEIEAELERNT